MSERVPVLVARADHAQIAVKALERQGLRAEVAAALGPGEFDLAVFDAEAVATGAMTELRSRSDQAVAVVVAPASLLAALVATLPLGSVAVPEEAAEALFERTLADALDARDLRDEVALRRDTHGLLTAVDPERIPNELVEIARRLLRADVTVLYVRGATGKLVAGPTARPLAMRSVPPSAAGEPAERPLTERVRLPAEALRRRSERLVRAQSQGAVVDALPDGQLLGRVLAGAERAHGVLWALRSPSRRAFDARDQATLDALIAHAALALDHHQVVRDLNDRLAGLQTTRQAMEADKRAAQVGRLAVDALRHLQAPLAYIRTNLRELAGTEEVHPAGQAARHLQYAFDGLARAETVAADMSRLSEQRERVPVEIRQLVESAQTLAGPLLAPTFVEIDTHAVILGHAARLSEGLAELLRNASEAVGVTRIDVRCSHLGNEVTLEVVDDGEGIAGDVLSRIREPFFSTRGRAGLGFTSACEAVEAGGGSVQIWSRAGIGTTVIVTLPSEIAEEELPIAADDADELDNVDDADDAVEPPPSGHTPEPLHSRKWMDDADEEESVAGLDFSDFGDLTSPED